MAQLAAHFRNSDLAKFAALGLSEAAVRVGSAWQRPNFSRALAAASLAAGFKASLLSVAKAKAVLGDGVSAQAIRDWAVELRARQMRLQLGCIADLSRRGWNPRMTVTGLEHLAGATARRRGTILWFDNFAYRSVVGLKAFAERGHHPFVMSARSHGVSTTRFGVRWLNRPWVKQQERHVRERIVFNLSDVVAATRRVVKLLAQNHLVAIANNGDMGAKIVIPLGEAHLPVATTPLGLAVTGVSVLPVTVIETVPLAEFEITVGPPLLPSQTEDRRTAIAELGAAYADHLLPLVGAHADQWMGWRHLRLASAD